MSSSDEEIITTTVEMSLYGILEERQDAVSAAEIWALLKESCVHMKYLLQQNIKINPFSLSDLILDSNGNIKIKSEHSKERLLQVDREKKSIIQYIGEAMMLIIDRYTVIDHNHELFLYILELMNDPNNDYESIHEIEKEADKHLTCSSIDAISNDLVSLKDAEDANSDFQDSFLSTECSLITDQDTDDSDPSICLTKDNDVLSPGSLGYLGFVSLAQLWRHCNAPIINCDEDCLILVHSLLMEVSNMLLNEDNLNKCLCVSPDNILLNHRGKLFLDFSKNFCIECTQQKSSMKYYDSKYIISIGNLVWEIIREDRRIQISQHIIQMISRMISITKSDLISTSVDELIINDVLHFCRAQMSVRPVSCRYALARLFEYWNNWFIDHQQKLQSLPHKYLINISNATQPIKKFLKPIPDNIKCSRPIEIRDIYSQDSEAMAQLKSVVQTKAPSQLENNDKSSAFRPYFKPKPAPSSSSILNNVKKDLSAFTVSAKLPSNSPNKPSSLKTQKNYFQPLVLPSEKSSLSASRENIFSPIDINHLNNLAKTDSLPNPKMVQSATQTPPTTVQRPTQPNCQHSSKFTPITASSSDQVTPQISGLTRTKLRKSQVNLTIGLIEQVISDSDISVDSRQILAIADFALSLETLSEFIFKEAIKQRFKEITWPEKTILELYKLVNKIEDGPIESDVEQKLPQYQDTIETIKTVKLRSETLPLTETQIAIKSPVDDFEDGNIFSYEEEKKQKIQSVSIKSASLTVPKARPNTIQLHKTDSNGSASSSNNMNRQSQTKPVTKNPSKLTTTKQLKTNEVVKVDSTRKSVSKYNPRNALEQYASSSASESSKAKTSSDIDGSSPFYPTKTKLPTSTTNNQLSIKESLLLRNDQQFMEDISFYENIFPTTLLCFPATLIFCNLHSNFLPDLNVGKKSIKATLDSFQKISQSVQFKFRQLVKTSEMINRCSEKTDKKVKKQFIADLREQEIFLQSQILNQMKVELTIVEYYSVNVKYIRKSLTHIDSFNSSNHSSNNAISLVGPLLNDGGHTNYGTFGLIGCTNLQEVTIDTLIGCLFIKGAINSSLLYEFLLTYREFMTSVEFINNLTNVYNGIETSIYTIFPKNSNNNHQSVICRARARLLFILLVWIDGFYLIDLTSDRIIALLWKLVSNKLSRYMLGVNSLVESTLDNARKNKLSSLTFQFTGAMKGVNSASQKVREIDIEQYLIRNQSKLSDRFIINSNKLKMSGSLSGILIGGNRNTNSSNQNNSALFLTNHNRDRRPINSFTSVSMINQNVFSIFELSNEILAICLTLINQQFFNEIHPCHFSTYFRALITKEQPLLHQLNHHRLTKSIEHQKSSSASLGVRNLIAEHKEVISLLQLSGKITKWTISEVQNLNDTKLQAKIVKKLIFCCQICHQLNNQAAATSILEGLNYLNIDRSSMAGHFNQKTLKLYQTLQSEQYKTTTTTTSPDPNLTYNSSNKLTTALLNGKPLLPCPQAVLIQLKFACVGSFKTSNGLIKWTKLKKMSDVLDYVRLCKQFQYISSNDGIRQLKDKLSRRIDHLASLSSYSG